MSVPGTPCFPFCVHWSQLSAPFPWALPARAHHVPWTSLGDTPESQVLSHPASRPAPLVKAPFHPHQGLPLGL